MAWEYERKFLVSGEQWRAQASQRLHIVQGYLGGDECSMSVRIEDSSHATLNVKGQQVGVARREYEYTIPRAEAEEMLALFCGARKLEKYRHLVDCNGLLWEVDEFLGENQGLVVAEIELIEPKAPFSVPEWLGCEVTDQLRYYNNRLVTTPYCSWN